jgi:hypothetical protein
MTLYIHLQIVGTLPRQLTSSSALNHSVQCVDHGVHYILAPLFCPARCREIEMLFFSGVAGVWWRR